MLVCVVVGSERAASSGHTEDDGRWEEEELGGPMTRQAPRLISLTLPSYVA